MVLLCYNVSYLLLFCVKKESENKLCERTSNGGCENGTTVCLQANGTTHCDCRDGYYRQLPVLENQCFGKLEVIITRYVRSNFVHETCNSIHE